MAQMLTNSKASLLANLCFICGNRLSLHDVALDGIDPDAFSGDPI